MNKNIDEKEETKVTKQEEYNQILELFGEKAEEIDLDEVQSIYIRKNPFTDNLKKVEEMTEEEKKKGLSRRRLREEAFKILFSMQFIKVDEQRVEIYCENNKYLERIIEENKKDTWDYSRLDKIAITLIKLAIIEIEYLEIPFKISINECINICKKYNEEKNTKFINGILANYVKIKGLDNGI